MTNPGQNSTPPAPAKNAASSPRLNSGPRLSTIYGDVTSIPSRLPHLPSPGGVSHWLFSTSGGDDLNIHLPGGQQVATLYGGSPRAPIQGYTFYNGKQQAIPNIPFSPGSPYWTAPTSPAENWGTMAAALISAITFMGVAPSAFSLPVALIAGQGSNLTS